MTDPTTLKHLDKLDALIKEGLEVRDIVRDLGQLPDREREDRNTRRTRWRLTVDTLLRQLGLDSYADRAHAFHEGTLYTANAVAHIVGVLQSARDLVAEGYLGKLSYLLQADFYGSALDQADALFTAGHTVPSAVLGRIVLEGWLRREADLAGVPEFASAKAATLNDQLHKRRVFSTPRWRLVQGHLDIGNAAAHGDTSAFSQDDVRRLLEFVRITCV